MNEKEWAAKKLRNDAYVCYAVARDDEDLSHAAGIDKVVKMLQESGIEEVESRKLAERASDDYQDALRGYDFEEYSNE